MRAGLRLQIVVLLGGLLLLAFVPLYVAVATYTSVALRQIRTAHARALGQSVGRHVEELQAHDSPPPLASLLVNQVNRGAAEALVAYDRQGRVLSSAGDRALLATLTTRRDVTQASSFDVKLARGRALAVVVPAASGSVLAVVRLDETAGAEPLLDLLALYTAVVGAALLLVAYFALTRLIVRPLDAVSRAAERVAAGARRLTLPSTRVRELAELASNLRAMTERLLSEEEALRRKVGEVEAATAHLRETQDRLVRSERLASVGRLSAGVAHEIGNPISALMGLLDLLLAGGLEPDEQRDFLQRMRKETLRIHGILSDLLQFAHPTRDSTKTREPGDVAGAVNDTAELVTPQKDMKAVELRLDLEPGLPLVALPREQLMQVLLNLVLNAADAVSAGGRVTVCARAARGSVELSVEDDGPGVALAVRARLFEPFVTTKEVGKGTGLGLAVCRGLVEAIGGSITLDEAYTGGARFLVVLPAAEP